jgi:geranylgeranyl pyrophosphate synthase
MIKHLTQHYCEQINQQLDRCLHSAQMSSAPHQLCEAMRYVVLGKAGRIRAQLLYAVGNQIGVSLQALHTAAVAIELMHAYTLVHDDLPAMDNDHFRRGKRCCHLAFDQSTAILVGDALQSLAFEVLSAPHDHLASGARVQMIQDLASAVGYNGLVAGQYLDLNVSNQSHQSMQDLLKIYQLKTANLFRVSVTLALHASQTNDAQCNQAVLQTYGEHIGIAYQIFDDIHDANDALDHEDAKSSLNMVSVYGLDVAVAMLEKRLLKAKKILDEYQFQGTLLCFHQQFQAKMQRVLSKESLL